MQRALALARGLLMTTGALSLLALAAFLALTGDGVPVTFPPPDRTPIPAPREGEALPDRALVASIFEGAFARRDADAMTSHYHDDAFLQDSWGTSVGKAQINAYYATQFEFAEGIRLRIAEYVQDGNQVVIGVIAEVDSPGLAVRLPAMLHLEFQDRKIRYQREYFDTAAYLDDAPLVGRLFRALRYYASQRI